jgi:hypothetical protein
MNRNELLKNIVLLYPKSFNENNHQIWLDAYKEVIPAIGIDFRKLYKIMITEHSSTAFAPPPAWFKDLISKVTIPKEEEEKEAEGERIPMPEWFKTGKADLLRKVSIGKSY